MDNYSKKKKNKFGTIYYINEEGKYHRLDGPACENKSDNKGWFINGKRHRIDGHAIEYEDGDKVSYLYDIMINKDKHKEHSDSIFGIEFD